MSKKLSVSSVLSEVAAHLSLPRQQVEDVIYTFIRILKYAPLFLDQEVVIRRFGRFFNRRVALPKPVYQRTGIYATMKTGYQMDETLEVERWKSTRWKLNQVMSALDVGQPLSLTDQLICAQIVDRSLSSLLEPEIGQKQLADLCKVWVQAVANSPLVKRGKIPFRGDGFCYKFTLASRAPVAYCVPAEVNEKDLKELLLPEEDGGIVFALNGWCAKSISTGQCSYQLNGYGANLIDRLTSLCKAYLEVK